MKPANKLAILALVGLVGVATPANAQLSNASPITLETQPTTLESFQALGERVAINVIAPKSFPVTGALISKVEARNVSEALDVLATQTNSFWTRWDDRTILVFPDTAQNRRDYERLFLRRLEVTGSPDQVVQELRDKQSVRGIRGNGNTLILRDVAAKIQLAESAIGKAATSLDVKDLEDLYVSETGSYRTPRSVRSQLSIKAPDPVSLNVNRPQQEIFEALARAAGVNIAFGRNYPLRNVAFRIDNVDFFDALDLLCIATNSFWQPVNDTTIAVFEATPQNRRDFGSQVGEILYFPQGTSTQDLNRTVNAMRTFLSLRGVYQNEAARALFVRDSVHNLMLAEAMAAEMSGSAGSVRKELVWNFLDNMSEAGGHRTAADPRSALQIKTAGRISLRMNSTVNETYEHLATLADFTLLIAAPNRTVPFNIEGLDIIDALDLLAMQSGTFWQPLDARTIQVLEDTQQNRRDHERQVVKTIYLPSSTSIQELNGISNLLRTALSARRIFVHEGAKAILVGDTPSRVAVIEKIIRQLNVHPDPVTSVSMTVPGVSETAVRGMAATAKSQLQFSVPGPITINLKHDLRGSFQTLAVVAGLGVSFDPRVATGGLVHLRFDDIDPLEALDYVSFQTRTFWKVVDTRNIVILPDTPEVHAELDPQVTKIYNLVNATAANTASIINAIRTAFSVRQIEQRSVGSIAIVDTPQRIALWEQVIASLDKVR